MSAQKIKGQLKDYFVRSMASSKELIGVEFEHFIIDEITFESLDYTRGIEKIMRKLLKKGWDKIDPQSEKILALKKYGHTITLEPSGQIEISLSPLEKISAIDSNYRMVKKEIQEAIDFHFTNVSLVNVGYHLKSCIDDLNLLPKKRYDQMYEYFKTKGKYAHNMMKGTASIQITIDYSSEKDFIKKFRVANFLSPYLYDLFDGSFIFEDHYYDKQNLRMNIWEHTDTLRCGIVDNALTKKDYNFDDYTDYILKTPPIFILKNDEYIYTGDQSLEDLSQYYDFSKEELEYILGMVFPDCRLKSYIELRMPDSIPSPYNLIPPMVIKNVFYNKNLLEKYFKMSLSYTDDDMNQLKDKMINDPHEVLDHDIVQQLLSDVKLLCTSEEKVILEQYYSILKEYGSFRQYLKSTYEHDKKRFLEIVKGVR